MLYFKSKKMKELVKIFKALGNERRLQILKVLINEGSLTLLEISKIINFSFKTVSKHLIILEDAGFVTRNLEGRRQYFAIAPLKKEDPQLEILKILKFYKLKREY